LRWDKPQRTCRWLDSRAWATGPYSAAICYGSQV
jgi:hypothetical protein